MVVIAKFSKIKPCNVKAEILLPDVPVASRMENSTFLSNIHISIVLFLHSYKYSLFSTSWMT